MVKAYLESRPDPAVLEFLKHDFDGLESTFGGVVATSFRAFPSYPQRFIEPLAVQPPCDPSLEGVEVEKVRVSQPPAQYTQDDLHIRHFKRDSSRRLVRKGQFRAA
jgi:hypothetical protein